jgi:hypothetical protein
MPFKSKAQQRFMFARHPKMAKKWAKHTKDIGSLPDKKSESAVPSMKEVFGARGHKDGGPQGATVAQGFEIQGDLKTKGVGEKEDDEHGHDD